MSPLRILAVSAFAAFAGTASAFDNDPNNQKVYPRIEHKYIKSFPTPSINCGTCFGYYPTQWRSWAEACGQPEAAVPTLPPVPEVKPADPKAKPPETAPIPKVDPKPVPDPAPLPNPKPVEPKAPAPSGKSAMLPVPVSAEPVSLTVQPPTQTEIVLPPLPLIPTLPTVNIK